jgi:hypothetical protein
MDLKRDECSQLFPSKHIFSQAFYVGGQGFLLIARCNKDEQSGLYGFGLFLWIDPALKGSSCVKVDYEFAARTRPSRQFVSKFNASHTFVGGVLVGCSDLFSVPWSTFLADDSLFIDGLLHLRVDLTVVGQTEPQT